MTRRVDMIETLTHQAVGIGLGFLVNLLVLPLIGVDTTFTTAWGITAIFFIVSTLRMYLLRRVFRWIGDRHAERHRDQEYDL